MWTFRSLGEPNYFQYSAKTLIDVMYIAYVSYGVEKMIKMWIKISLLLNFFCYITCAFVIWKNYSCTMSRFAGLRKKWRQDIILAGKRGHKKESERKPGTLDTNPPGHSRIGVHYFTHCVSTPVQKTNRIATLTLVPGKQNTYTMRKDNDHLGCGLVGHLKFSGLVLLW